MAKAQCARTPVFPAALKAEVGGIKSKNSRPALITKQGLSKKKKKKRRKGSCVED